MKASDIMSAPVFSVAPDTPVKEIAALLFRKRISGVPVLDKGKLVGMVSEGDRLARDVMSRDVTTTSPDTSVADIASLLESAGIKRVPVMRGEKLVGIVSRANLVQAIASMRPAAVRATPPADQAIRGRLQAELARQPWWHDAASNVMVTDGVVHYFGTVRSDDEQDAARVAAENIPGVRGVEDHRVRYAEIGRWD